jgi:hypothetical protein
VSSRFRVSRINSKLRLLIDSLPSSLAMLSISPFVKSRRYSNQRSSNPLTGGSFQFKAMPAISISPETLTVPLACSFSLTRYLGKPEASAHLGVSEAIDHGLLMG